MLDRRIIQVRLLFSLGEEVYIRSNPTNTYSLLLFHDSIELFLGLIIEYLTISVSSNIDFMGYWDLIEKNCGITLSGKEGMRKLNKARVSLKHHGLMPSESDLEHFKHLTLLFFEENCRKVFNVDFHSIKISQLIQYSKSRRHFDLAKLYYGKKDQQKAGANYALSFEKLVYEYEKAKKDFYRSPFFFGEDMSFMGSFSLGIARSQDPLGYSGTTEKVSKFIDAAQKSIKQIQSALKIVSLGLDYKKYVRFKLLTPAVVKTSGGFFVNNKIPDGFEYTENEIIFMENFILESALKLQSVEYSLTEFLTRLKSHCV